MRCVTFANALDRVLTTHACVNYWRITQDWTNGNYYNGALNHNRPTNRPESLGTWCAYALLYFSAAKITNLSLERERERTSVVL